MLRLFVLLGLFFCATCDEKDWWKNTIIYEIFIRSFKDSNGDGIGDLKGITSKLDYIADLGIDSIWITPFFESPQDDMGYDITNFTKPDPIFGTIEDFEELSREARKRGIKIFMDCVINHSSDEHIWFKKSKLKLKPYDEYYVWKDAKAFDKNGRPIPPNNWVSVFGGTAWGWSAKRKQFYLRSFGKKQVDLNLRNEEVKQQIKDILKFWFNKGVIGLRLDAAGHYIEDSQFRDEPLLNPEIKKDEYGWNDLDHIYTQDVGESYEVLHELREFVEAVNEKEGGYPRIMVAEIFTKLNKTMAYYGNESYPIVHFPFNFFLVFAHKYLPASMLHATITEWLDNMPKNSVPNWVAENHDVYRIGSRFIPEYVNIVNILMMMLPGVPCIYYGQEIGMINGPVRPDQRQDPYADGHTLLQRDPQRTPMQWDDTPNAGFTSNVKPWLPVNPNYQFHNVERQKKQADSYYNIFKELSKLRKTATSKYGKFNSYVLSSWIYGFTRTLEEHDTFVTIFNLGTEMEIVDLHANIPNLQAHLEVLVASSNAGYKKGDVIKTESKFPTSFVLRPMSAVVLCSA